MNAHHGRRDALLLVDTDHAAGLCGDLESFRLEDRLAAHQAQQLVLFVAYRIDRIMAGKRELHGFGHGHAGPEHEHLAQHEIGEPRLPLGQQQVAHRDKAEKFAIRIRHITISDERDLDQLA
jgi:hypothetical protein